MNAQTIHGNLPDRVSSASRAPNAEPRGLIAGRAVSAVLFDLDGTLVETDDRAVQHLAQRLSRVQRLLPRQDPLRTARRLVMRSHDGLQGWLTLLDRLGLDAVTQRAAQRLGLLDDNADGHRLVPVAGTTSLLQALSSRYPVGIVSTRRAAEVYAYLQQQGLDGQVSVVVGSDTTRRIKPHPEPVLWAARALGVTPDTCVMVGDTVADVAAAKAAGAMAVGVLCGFGEPDDLTKADLVLPSTADLAQWL